MMIKNPYIVFKYFIYSKLFSIVLLFLITFSHVQGQEIPLDHFIKCDVCDLYYELIEFPENDIVCGSQHIRIHFKGFWEIPAAGYGSKYITVELYRDDSLSKFYDFSSGGNFILDIFTGDTNGDYSLVISCFRWYSSNPVIDPNQSLDYRCIAFPERKPFSQCVHRFKIADILEPNDPYFRINNHSEYGKIMPALSRCEIETMNIEWLGGYENEELINYPGIKHRYFIGNKSPQSTGVDYTPVYDVQNEFESGLPEKFASGLDKFGKYLPYIYQNDQPFFVLEIMFYNCLVQYAIPFYYYGQHGDNNLYIKIARHLNPNPGFNEGDHTKYEKEDPRKYRIGVSGDEVNCNSNITGAIFQSVYLPAIMDEFPLANHFDLKKLNISSVHLTIFNETLGVLIDDTQIVENGSYYFWMHPFNSFNTVSPFFIPQGVTDTYNYFHYAYAFRHETDPATDHSSLDKIYEVTFTVEIDCGPESKDFISGSCEFGINPSAHGGIYKPEIIDPFAIDDINDLRGLNSTQEIQEVSLFDLSGKLIYKATSVPQDWKLQWMQNVSPGMYIYKQKQGSESISGKYYVPFR